MKKRIIVSLFLVVAITSILLTLSIFKLYTEAEKVQRSIFVNEVLDAGEAIVNRIDATIMNDTLDLTNTDSTVTDVVDTTDIVEVQRARKFLLDSTNQQPIGVIKSVIYVKENNVRVVDNDTVYFSQAYRTLFPVYNNPWSPKNGKEPTAPNIAKNDVNLVQLDSLTIELLNWEYLRNTIKEALMAENINAKFDFALYNAFTTEFIVEPTYSTEEVMLHSDYVFRLKYNEKVSSPHYIILYFPGERSIFLQRMSTIVGLILCLLFISFTFTFVSLYSYYRQKKLSEVTNEFTNNMTHEFKTPISTISLACEALSDPNLHSDAAMREAYISIINDENERLKNMVSNILQIARLKKGLVKVKV